METPIPQDTGKAPRRSLGIFVCARWVLFWFFAIIGLALLFAIVCYLIAIGLSFFHRGPTAVQFEFDTVFSVSNVIALLSILIAFVTLLLGVGAFFGYSSLRDAAKSTAKEIANGIAEVTALKVAKDVAEKTASSEAIIALQRNTQENALKDAVKLQFEDVGLRKYDTLIKKMLLEQEMNQKLSSKNENKEEA